MVDHDRPLVTHLVNEAEPCWLLLIDNEGKLSNCFSINQLVRLNILKKRTKTFSAIVLNLKKISFATDDLSPIDSE